MLVAVHETPQTLTVRPWPDSVLDQVGHDPRSSYVEQFWLGVLGPSSVVFLRKLAAELEAHPSGFERSLAETAKTLGLGMRGGATRRSSARSIAARSSAWCTSRRTIGCCWRGASCRR